MQLSRFWGLALLCVLNSGPVHAAPLPVQKLKAKCIVNKNPPDVCKSEVMEYCKSGPEAATNCLKLSIYFTNKAKLVMGRVQLSSLATNQKSYKIQWNKFSVDLTPVYPSLDGKPQSVILAISEQCAVKYGAGKGAWNSYQVAEAGKVILAPHVLAKRSETEALIRKLLPTCKNPNGAIDMISLTYLPRMTKADVYIANQQKGLPKQLIEGLSIPELL